MSFTQREIDAFSDNVARFYGVPEHEIRSVIGRPPLFGCDVPRQVRTEADATAVVKALEHRWRAE